MAALSPDSGSGPLKAIVLPDIDPIRGGTSVSIPALCAAMHAQDPTVGMYFSASTIDPAWPDYYQPHLTSFPRSIHSSRSLCRTLRSGAFSIVHHHALWLPSLGYAASAARHSRSPLIISPRGMLSRYGLSRSRFKKWLARRFLHPGAMRQAAAWHATSTLEFDDIRAAGFRQPILVSANGVQPPPWSDPEDRRAWLARYPALEGKRIALFFSRLHSKKGVVPLLEYWARLETKHRDWHLLVCGTADEYDVRQVQSHVDRLGLAHRTTVAAPERLAKPYRLAELYVLPTQSENFGLTIAEALSMGVSVLTSTGAPWSQMHELGCGECVPLNRFEERWSAMMSADSSQLQAMGRVGSEWVRREFCWEQRAAEMLAFYRSLGGV
jgi:glycosyltransferase involved in cell wall biosynthesis